MSHKPLTKITKSLRSRSCWARATSERNDISGILMGDVKDGYLIEAVLVSTLVLEPSVAACVKILQSQTVEGEQQGSPVKVHTSRMRF
ncbi:hypothetical protein P7K49_005183 [Saguinus oedipus]|uniref:Uncharacterized protein n=1 Tax=Saguinus oedipus TaxID=9490 RepID=A0ABQ9WAE0_SAGOE|nr:hypothetical protein P7K49_005183 [Saguinus oedipus]